MHCSIFDFFTHNISSCFYYYVQVTQFMKCFEGEADENTDPTMVILRPVMEWKSDYTFSTITDWFGNSYTSTHMNVVAPTADAMEIILDGVSINGAWTVIGVTGYSGIQLPVSDGLHRILHPDGAVFSAVIYGQSHRDSYGFHVGETAVDDLTTVGSTMERSTAIELTTSVTTDQTTHVVTPTVEHSTLELTTVETTMPALEVTTKEQSSTELTTMDPTTTEHSTLTNTTIVLTSELFSMKGHNVQPTTSVISFKELTSGAPTTSELKTLPGTLSHTPDTAMWLIVDNSTEAWNAISSVTIAHSVTGDIPTHQTTTNTSKGGRYNIQY